MVIIKSPILQMYYTRRFSHFDLQHTMITIKTQARFETLLAAVLLKQILVSNTVKIVLESDLNSSKLSLAIESYSLENLLHEYERKFGNLEIIHHPSQLWEKIKDEVQVYLMDHDTIDDITMIINDFEHILKEEGRHQLFSSKMFLRKLRLKNKKPYSLQLLPLSFMSRS